MHPPCMAGAQLSGVGAGVDRGRARAGSGRVAALRGGRGAHVARVSAPGVLCVTPRDPTRVRPCGLSRATRPKGFQRSGGSVYQSTRGIPKTRRVGFAFDPGHSQDPASRSPDRPGAFQGPGESMPRSTRRVPKTRRVNSPIDPGHSNDDPTHSQDPPGQFANRPGAFQRAGESAFPSTQCGPGNRQLGCPSAGAAATSRRAGANDRLPGPDTPRRPPRYRAARRLPLDLISI